MFGIMRNAWIDEVRARRRNRVMAPEEKGENVGGVTGEDHAEVLAAQTAMAAIGAATNDKMADMLEAHEGHMVFARQVLEQKAKADERFARRFAKIVEKHDKNAYGE